MQSIFLKQHKDKMITSTHTFPWGDILDTSLYMSDHMHKSGNTYISNITLCFPWFRDGYIEGCNTGVWLQSVDIL